MILPLTAAAIATALGLAVVSVVYLVRDRIVDDALLLVAAVAELVLLVLAVGALLRFRDVTDPAEGATLLAYALTLPFVPPGVVLVALKEKTRWSMGVLLAGALTVAVMAYRIREIWVVGA